MPNVDGIQALNALVEQGTETPVIILTTFDDHEFILRGLQAEAKGYLLKDVSLETLIEGIETVRAGDRLVLPALTERLMSMPACTQGLLSAPFPETSN